MSGESEGPIEHRLIRDASLLDMSVIESDVRPTVGDEDWIVRMQLQVDEDMVDSCAHGLIFAIGVLSFHDARPRGVSGKGRRSSTAWFAVCGARAPHGLAVLTARSPILG